jgi:hypothetical protein
LTPPIIGGTDNMIMIIMIIVGIIPPATMIGSTGGCRHDAAGAIMAPAPRFDRCNFPGHVR